MIEFHVHHVRGASLLEEIAALWPEFQQKVAVGDDYKITVHWPCGKEKSTIDMRLA